MRTDGLEMMEIHQNLEKVVLSSMKFCREERVAWPADSRNNGCGPWDPCPAAPCLPIISQHVCDCCAFVLWLPGWLRNWRWATACLGRIMRPGMARESTNRSRLVAVDALRCALRCVCAALRRPLCCVSPLVQPAQLSQLSQLLLYSPSQKLYYLLIPALSYSVLAAENTHHAGFASWSLRSFAASVSYSPTNGVLILSKPRPACLSPSLLLPLYDRAILVPHLLQTTVPPANRGNSTNLFPSLPAACIALCPPFNSRHTSLVHVALLSS